MHASVNKKLKHKMHHNGRMAIYLWDTLMAATLPEVSIGDGVGN